jgi:signal peptidase I
MDADASTGAGAPADESILPASPATERRPSLWRELPVLAVIALVLALLIKTFLVQAFYIPSGSMQNTLQPGDRVLVSKLTYRFRDIQRGDVVVFNGVDSFAPEVTVVQPTNPVRRALQWGASALGLPTVNETDFIKRVIGVPGDRVRCCDPQGRVTVNGQPLDEPYLYPGDVPSTTTFDVVVPAGKLWVMGDHRSDSKDSRSYLGDPGGGMVPESRVVGRAFAIVWPLNRATLLSIPATFLTPALAPPAGGPPLALFLVAVALVVAGLAVWWFLRASRHRAAAHE